MGITVKISNNITYKEATKSRTASKHGLDNKPDGEPLKNMKLVAEKIFQPVREHFGVRIYISSFFRSEEVNKKTGGSKKSQHVQGKAIDMDADVFGEITNADIFKYIKNNLEFDQLIWEFGDDYNPDWVHVSYNEGKNRKNILVAYKEEDAAGKKRTKYKKWK